MIERYDVAPMDGITRAVFRRVHHRMFGGADRYFIPFFSPTDQHIITRRDLRELDPANNVGLPLVPQIMTRRAPDFLWGAQVMEEMGYGEVNLNLGCPSGTVTAKGKGSGFLAHPNELAAFFDEVFSKNPLPVSVKTRLGYEAPEEFTALLDLYNRYPIACLTVHPRVRKEKYRGPVHLDVFADALANSRNPVCYNGDLLTVEDCRAFEQEFPQVNAVMIGRAVVADPALLRKALGGAGATREDLRGYLDDLYHGYTELFGSAGGAVSRMKGHWFYLIHKFEGAEKLEKQLRKAREPWEYEVVVNQIFTLPMV